MAKYTRGEFLGFGAALAGAFTLGRAPGGRKIVQPLAAQPATAASLGEPDLVVVNARVLTSDAAAPRAEAFAVKAWPLHRGRIDGRRPQPRDGAARRWSTRSG